MQTGFKCFCMLELRCLCIVLKIPNVAFWLGDTIYLTKGVFIHEHLVMTSLPAHEQIACVNAFRKCLAPD